VYRLVLDTNVVVSALLWGGRPRRIFTAAQDGSIDLFTSIPLVQELEDILHRSKFTQKLSQLRFDIPDVLDAYLAVATLVDPPKLPRTAPDPDDDVVLATALAAEAHLLVSGDEHLLSLVSFQGISIRRASDALDVLADFRF
jgi:uncharacterized protein